MIIEDKKIIFCHVDKTAGSSISKNLNKNLVDDKEPIRYWRLIYEIYRTIRRTASNKNLTKYKKLRLNRRIFVY